MPTGSGIEFEHQSDGWWKKKVLQQIEFLSDKNYQKENWILNKNKDIADSFQESMNMLYDDYEFLKFILACENREICSDITGKIMRMLHERIRNHKNTHPDEPYEEEHLDSDSWNAVVDAAKKARFALAADLTSQ